MRLWRWWGVMLHRRARSQPQRLHLLLSHSDWVTPASPSVIILAIQLMHIGRLIIILEGWHNFRAHLNWQTVNEITPHHTCIVQSYKRQVLNKAATEAVVYVGLRRLALERVSIIRRGGGVCYGGITRSATTSSCISRLPGCI